MRLAVFSLCSNQGVHQAQVLFETIATFLPEADRFLILADAHHPAVSYPDGCVIIAADELGIPDFANLAFRYKRREFAAAIKPFAFLHMLGARGYTHCLFFDPAIELFSPLPAVRAALAADASFILTPHILAPAEQEGGADDVAIMRGGTFNLGFLGVSATPEARDRLRWWSRWLRTHCVDDRPIGLFIDQKFMDLMPGLARGARILRDPGLNLGYWNLPQRQFEPAAPGGPTVDGGPLGFFHYSGFDPASPDRLSAEAGTVGGGALPSSWRRFLAGYADRLKAAGHGRIPAGCYAYGRFASGVPVPDIARRMFRDDFPAWSGDPFESFEAWTHLPALGAVLGIGSATPSTTMQWLQARDPRLVRFSLADPAGAAHLTRWWLERGPAIGIDRRFLEPEAAAAGLRPLSPRAAFPPPGPGWADATVFAPAAGPGSLGEVSVAGLVGQAQRASLGLAAGRVEACDVGSPEAASGRVLGFCVAPDRLAPVLASVGPLLPDKAYRVFVPSAERMILPPSCLDALSGIDGGIDEVWAPTRFIQAALVLATTRPVLHMPVAWRFPPPLASGGAGILEGRPYVLAEGDGFPGCGALAAAVRAYALVFEGGVSERRPILAIRAEASACADEGLRAAIAAAGGVILPPAADPATLIVGATCLLALHRGEAVGLTILRAMAAGVPVIATDYGGCTDLLTPKTGFPLDFRLVPMAADVEAESGPEGGAEVWAEADPEHAAWSLRDLISRPEAARRRADEARRQFASLHNPATVAAAQARRLGLVERLAARAYNCVAA